MRGIKKTTTADAVREWQRGLAEERDKWGESGWRKWWTSGWGMRMCFRSWCAAQKECIICVWDCQQWAVRRHHRQHPHTHTHTMETMREWKRWSNRWRYRIPYSESGGETAEWEDERVSKKCAQNNRRWKQQLVFFFGCISSFDFLMQSYSYLIHSWLVSLHHQSICTNVLKKRSLPDPTAGWRGPNAFERLNVQNVSDFFVKVLFFHFCVWIPDSGSENQIINLAQIQPTTGIRRE